MRKFIFLFLAAAMIGSPQKSFAFSLFHKASSSEAKAVSKKFPILTSEDETWRVLFMPTNRTEERADEFGEKKKLREIQYKVSNRLGAEGLPEPRVGGQRVRLLDKGGFVLAQEDIPLDKFSAAGEYYGSMWVDQKKVKYLSQADVVRLLDPGQEAPASAAKKESSALLESSVSSSLAGEETKESAQGKPSSKSKSKPKHLTNEDITDTLRQFEHQLPTKIGEPASDKNAGDEEGKQNDNENSVSVTKEITS